MDYLSLAFVLAVIGVILLAAEVLIPTGGFLIVAALLFFAAAVGTIIANGDTAEAAFAVGGLALGLPVVGFVMVAAWQRLAIGRSLAAGGGNDLVAGMPHVAELEYLRGRLGRTVSPMRPSGTVLIDGRRIDAMSEGMPLDADTWVKCVDVKGSRVLVRRMDVPPDLADIDPEGGPRPAVKPTAPVPRDVDDLDLGFDLPPK